MRDLGWLIDSIDYDHLEDHDDVQGSWRIRWGSKDPNVVVVLYEPYDDGSQDTYYPPKATKYRLTLLEEVEGDLAKPSFNKWQDTE